jgi:hypothetical protein
MNACLPHEKGCLRDSMLNDFLAYRQWYGIIPPEHEQSIRLGDLGYFNTNGKFVKVGGMFDLSETSPLRNGSADGAIQRPSPENIKWSEEIVSDPFVSTTTGWARVPEDKIGEYMLC